MVKYESNHLIIYQDPTRIVSGRPPAQPVWYGRPPTQPPPRGGGVKKMGGASIETGKRVLSVINNNY
jgi:hypothetical protein